MSRPDAWPAGFGQGRWPQQWPDTMPTEPARLDGAHACSDIGQDDGPPRDPLSAGDLVALMVIMFVSALCVIGTAVVIVARWQP